MTYHLPPASFTPGLEPDDLHGVFDAMVELHLEEQRRQALDSTRSQLQQRFGGRL